MRSFIGKSLACLILLAVFVPAFVGCSAEEKETRLDTQLTVSAEFDGQRVMTCKFPDSISMSDSATAKLDEIVNKYCPSDITASKLNGDGLAYTFTIDFDSKSDYCSKLKNITGLDLDVSFGMYDNIITKGWCLYEDFSTEMPIAWLYDAIEENKAEELYYTYDTDSKPVVTVDGKTGKSAESLHINASNITGSAVHSVEVETTNYKNKTYDRKIKLIFPETTHNKFGEELENYISEAAGHTTSESWTKSGNYYVFEALYQGIDYTEMGNVTSSLLFCKDESIKYGDLTNSSTPLAEQLVFEEKLNLLAFVPEKGKKVGLTYSYTIPSDTSGGDGIILTQGSWEKSGQWQDGKYTLNSESPSLTLRIPDGKQYIPKSIDITLSKTDENSFKRVMDFVYPVNSTEGHNYTCDYFTRLGAKVIRESNANNEPICRMVIEGEPTYISEQLGRIFGGGNFITVKESSRLSSVVTSIDLSESLNIDYMLPKSKSSTPITYTVMKTTGENINKFSTLTNGEEIEFELSDNTENSLTMDLTSGNTVVNLSATVPYTKGIIFCVSIFSVILLLCVALTTYMLKRDSINEDAMRNKHNRKMKLRRRPLDRKE